MMKKRRYSAEFQSAAVEMVLNGRAAKEVSQELEIELSCLYAWVRKARGSGASASVSATAGVLADGDRDELKRLRRENQKLLMENAILKKAAIILGTNPSLPSAK